MYRVSKSGRQDAHEEAGGRDRVCGVDLISADRPAIRKSARVFAATRSELETTT